MPNHIPILAEPGELVIPRQLAGDIIPQLQKALAKTNDDMEKFPGVNGLDFRQYMVGSPEARVDPETGMEMFPLGSPTGRPGRSGRTGFGMGSPTGRPGRSGPEDFSFNDVQAVPQSPSFGGLGDPGGPGGGYGPVGSNDPYGGGGLGDTGGFEQNVKVQPLAGIDPEAGSEKLYGDFFTGEKADIGNVSLVEPGKPMLGGADIGGALVAKMFGLNRLVAQGGLPGFGTEEGTEVIQGSLPSPVSIQGQGFNRPDLLEAPGNFGFAGLDELQQRSRIATEGLFGNSLFRGDEAQNVFKNLLQRSLIGAGGQLGDINSLLPVERDYITQVLGLDISNLESLLGALR